MKAIGGLRVLSDGQGMLESQGVECLEFGLGEVGVCVWDGE